MDEKGNTNLQRDIKKDAATNVPTFAQLGCLDAVGKVTRRGWHLRSFYHTDKNPIVPL